MSEQGAWAGIVRLILNKLGLAICFMGLAISTGFILFAPVRVLQAVGVSILSIEYRLYTGLLLVLSLSMLLSMCIPYLSVFARKLIKNCKYFIYKRDLTNKIKSLASDEIKIIRSYLQKSSELEYLQLTPAVIRLQQKKLIYRPLGFRHRIYEYPFLLSEGVREIIYELIQKETINSSDAVDYNNSPVIGNP